jgi:hypothetical protein
VRNRNQGGEQITTPKDVERMRAANRILSEKQRRRDQIADQHQGLLDQDEAREIQPLGPSKRQGRQNHRQQQT